MGVQQYDKLPLKIFISIFLRLKGHLKQDLAGGSPWPSSTHYFSFDLNVGLQNTLVKFATITKPGRLQALGRTALGVKWSSQIQAKR